MRFSYVADFISLFLVGVWICCLLLFFFCLWMVGFVCCVVTCWALYGCGSWLCWCVLVCMVFPGFVCVWFGCDCFLHSGLMVLIVAVPVEFRGVSVDCWALCAMFFEWGCGW